MTMYMDRKVEKKIFLVLQKRLQIYKLTFHNHGVSLLNCLTGATMFLKCAHPAIDGERQREIMWLKDGSAEHQVLQAVANDKKLLTDMDKLSEFRHTGGLENFHSLLLKWAPKRIHFFYAGMRARIQIASLYHNHNVGRQQARTKAGGLRNSLVF